MAYSLQWESRGIVVTYSGTVKLGEVLECHERIAAHPRFSDLRYAIVDTLSVQALSLAESDVGWIDAFLRGPALTNPAIRVAIVADSPSVLRALAWYDRISDRAYPASVFSSIESARSGVAMPH